METRLTRRLEQEPLDKLILDLEFNGADPAALIVAEIAEHLANLFFHVDRHVLKRAFAEGVDKSPQLPAPLEGFFESLERY